MDIEWVIYHLTHNDDEDFTSIADLDIDLCRSDQDQWERFLTGLGRNRTVRTIELSRGYQLPVVNDDDLLCLFRALRRIPRLSRVKLHSFTTFDLDQSHPLFEDNTTIEEVWIENGNSYDDDDDDLNDDLNDDTIGGADGDECYNQYERFLGFLSSMKRLRHLRIEMPSILSRAVPLAPLLMVSPKLESLVLETTSLVSSSAVSTLTQRVRVRNEWQQQNFGAAMLALRSNKVLRVLDMDFLISFSDFQQVASMLQHNNTLTDLCLRLDPSTAMARCRGGDSNGNDNGNDNGNGNGNAHRGCREFHCHFQDSIRRFFEALKSNTSSALRRFKQYNFEDPAFLFSQPKPNEETNNNQKYAAIARDLVDICFDMLEWNLSLEEFSFFLIDQQDNHHHIQTNSREKKELFLRLNERGRKTVHHHDRRERVSRACFVSQLAKHTVDHDLNGVYYYICTNPSICKTPTSHEDACRRSAAETICEERRIVWKKQKVEQME